MPGFDRSGPWGEGPMTGWQRGYCGGGRAASQRFVGGYGRGGFRGRGRRVGRGSGYGFGPGYGPAPGYEYGPAPAEDVYHDDAEELGVLKDEAKALRSRMARIDRRIAELEAAESKPE